MISFIFSHFLLLLLLLSTIITGKEIGRSHKHGQYQLSTPSIKALVLSYLAYQTSSYIELTITYVPSVIDKNQTNSILCSEKYIHNDLSISDNDAIK